MREPPRAAPLRNLRVVLSLREDYLGRFRDRLRDHRRLLDHGVPRRSAHGRRARRGRVPRPRPRAASAGVDQPSAMRTLMLQVRVPGQAEVGRGRGAGGVRADRVPRALPAARPGGRRGGQTRSRPSPSCAATWRRRSTDLGALREAAQRLLEDHLVTADGSRTLRTEKELLRIVPADRAQPILKALERRGHPPRRGAPGEPVLRDRPRLAGAQGLRAAAAARRAEEQRRREEEQRLREEEQEGARARARAGGEAARRGARARRRFFAPRPSWRSWWRRAPWRWASMAYDQRAAARNACASRGPEARRGRRLRRCTEEKRSEASRRAPAPRAFRELAEQRPAPAGDEAVAGGGAAREARAAGSSWRATRSATNALRAPSTATAGRRSPRPCGAMDDGERVLSRRPTTGAARRVARRRRGSARRALQGTVGSGSSRPP